MNSDNGDIHLSPGRPSAEQSQAISGRILDAGERLFVDTGFEAVSMDMVARMAHVSKRTLYERFFGKAELLKAAIERRFERKLAEIDRISVPTGSLEHSLGRLSDRLVELVADRDYVALHRILAAEQHRFPDLFESHSREAGARIAAVVEQVLVRPCSGNEFPHDEAKAASDLFVAMVISPSARRIAIGDRQAGAEFNRRAIRVFLNGIVADRGPRRISTATAEEKNARQSTSTKSRILEAAIHRFATASYEQVGLRDIAQDVGVDIAYVQRSYGSKMGLFISALNEASGSDRDPIWTSVSDLPDAVVRLVGENDEQHTPRQLALSIALQSLMSPAAGPIVSERFSRNFIEPMAASLPEPAHTRAKLIASILVGLGLIDRFVEPSHGERQNVERMRLLHAALSLLISEKA